jgi:hypothetical protein
MVEKVIRFQESPMLYVNDKCAHKPCMYVYCCKQYLNGRLALIGSHSEDIDCWMGNGFFKNLREFEAFLANY